MMKFARIVCLAGLALGIARGPTLADPAPAQQDKASPFMRVFGVTQPPHGFVSFCFREPQECSEAVMEEQRFFMDKQRGAQLAAVNSHVNRTIEPATDQEIYGVSEYWAIPTTRGDCEDYALLKRQTLMKAGWPASALLMTVVFDERGDGHAVLTARTMQGDFILDNKTDDIRLWSKTAYQYVMRQSYLNPRVWMALDPAEVNPSVPLAGVRSNH